MLLWETEFFTISMVTGEIDKKNGLFILARTLPDAIKASRRSGLDYYQFTGRSFKDEQAVLRDREFYSGIEDPRSLVQHMTYDEFMDWLDLANNLGDLFEAKYEFSKYPDLSEHVKIIETQINNYEEKEDHENDKEEEAGG